jgi:hypothetical protein
MRYEIFGDRTQEPRTKKKDKREAVLQKNDFLIMSVE